MQTSDKLRWLEPFDDLVRPLCHEWLQCHNHDIVPVWFQLNGTAFCSIALIFKQSFSVQKAHLRFIFFLFHVWFVLQATMRSFYQDSFMLQIQMYLFKYRRKSFRLEGKPICRFFFLLLDLNAMTF